MLDQLQTEMNELNETSKAEDQIVETKDEKGGDASYYPSL